MRLKEKKMKIASAILRRIDELKYPAGKFDSQDTFICNLQGMAIGEDIAFTGEMNWVVHHESLRDDHQLRELFNKLNGIESYIKIFGWLPWV